MMVSLEQIRILEVKVRSLVETLKEHKESNLALTKRNEELEALSDSHVSDVQKIEVELQGVLDIFDEVEERDSNNTKPESTEAESNNDETDSNASGDKEIESEKPHTAEMNSMTSEELPKQFESESKLDNSPSDDSSSDYKAETHPDDILEEVDLDNSKLSYSDSEDQQSEFDIF